MIYYIKCIRNHVPALIEVCRGLSSIELFTRSIRQRISRWIPYICSINVKRNFKEKEISLFLIDSQDIM